MVHQNTQHYVASGTQKCSCVMVRILEPEAEGTQLALLFAFVSFWLWFGTSFFNHRHNSEVKESSFQSLFVHLDVHYFFIFRIYGLAFHNSTANRKWIQENAAKHCKKPPNSKNEDSTEKMRKQKKQMKKIKPKWTAKWFKKRKNTEIVISSV